MSISILHNSKDSFRIGDVVIANVRNPLENSRSMGKNRPFVLVSQSEGHWGGMGLTTRPRYASGGDRTPIPNPVAIGLRGPGFLWGDRLTDVSALDLERRIGHIDAPLAEAIIDIIHASDEMALTLRRVAK